MASGTQGKGSVSYRIPKALGYILIGFAVVTDGIIALMKVLWFTVILAILGEAIGWFVSMFAAMTFSVIFASLLGSDFIGGRRIHRKILRFACTVIIKLVPFLDAVPAFTFFVWFTVKDSHKEDEEQAEEKAKKTNIQNVKIKQMQKLRRLRARLMRQEEPTPASGPQAPQNSTPANNTRPVAPSDTRNQPVIRNYAEFPPVAYDKAPRPANDNKQSLPYERDVRPPKAT